MLAALHLITLSIAGHRRHGQSVRVPPVQTLPAASIPQVAARSA